MTLDDYIPEAKFGQDHFSTLAYVETVMVEMKGFQIGLDPRMRSNRRHFRVMHQECPRPKRTSNKGQMAIVMSPEHGSRLKDGSVMDGHDDWMCLQDMAEIGYFTVTKGKKHQVVDASALQPGVTIHLSERGREVNEALRRHKAEGGSFGNFTAPETAPVQQVAP